MTSPFTILIPGGEIWTPAAVGITDATFTIINPGGGFFATYRDDGLTPDPGAFNSQRIEGSQFIFHYPLPCTVFCLADVDTRLLVYI